MSDQPVSAQTARRINRQSLWLWVLVSMIYVALAAYTAWFSVDRDLMQATTWFALAVCFFCVGLIPMQAASSKEINDLQIGNGQSSTKE